MGIRNLGPIPGPLAQGSTVKNISTHNFGLHKPTRIESVEETFLSPKQFLLKNPHTASLLKLTPSELQHWGDSLKDTSGTQGRTEVSCIGARRGHCPFSKPFPNTAPETASWCHI